MKRIIWIIMFLVILNFVAASKDIDLEISNHPFGTNQLFDGNVIIGYDGNVSLDKELEAKIKRPGGYDIYKTSLEDFIKNLNFQVGKKHYSTVGSPQLKIALSRNTIIGIDMPDFDYIDSASINFSGNNVSVSMDFDDDGSLDWKNKGDLEGWSGPYHPEDVEGDESTNNRAEIKGGDHSEICEEIFIDFDELYDTSKLKIDLKVKKIREGGSLNVSATNGDWKFAKCEAVDSTLDDILDDISCLVDVKAENTTFEVCVSSEKGDSNVVYYELPWSVIGGEDYYFFNVKKAIYDGKLTGEVEFGGDDFAELFDGRIGLIPIKIYTDGNLNVGDLKIVSGSSKYKNLYNIDYNPGYVVVDDHIDIPLSNFPKLRTPSSYDEDYNYKLRITMDDFGSDEKEFEMTEGYNVYIDSVNLAIVNDPISFGGRSSNTIWSWNWDFGDGTNVSGKDVTHFYSQEGEFNVRLTVSDDNQVQSSAYKIIYVGNLEDNLDDMLNSTMSKINLVNCGVECKSLGFDSVMNSARNNLSYLLTDFNSVKGSNLDENAKNVRYNGIYDDLISIKEKVPDNFDINIERVQNWQIGYDNLPDVTIFRDDLDTYSKETAYKESVYQFNQDNVDVNYEASEVKVRYLSGDENTFVIVDKTVSVNGGRNNIFVEDISGEITMLTAGSEDSGYYVWSITGGSVNVKYYFEGSLEDLEYVYSTVLSDVEYSVDISIECGNNICEYNSELNIDEANRYDDYYCKEDCEKEIPWMIFIILIVVLVVGILFFNFYRGPGSLKRRAPEKKEKSNVYKAEDLSILTYYIRSSLERGFDRKDIREALLDKGWSPDQVNEAFKKI